MHALRTTLSLGLVIRNAHPACPLEYPAAFFLLLISTLLRLSLSGNNKRPF